MAAPRAAVILGYAGLAPFVTFAAAMAVAPEGYREDARAGLLIYGAVILSFLGGCRWGFAAAGLGQGPAFGPLALSTAPALLGWAVLWMEPAFAQPTPAWVLAAGFAAHYAWDAFGATRGDTPVWWGGLRLPLTLGAAGCLIVSTAFA